MDCFKKKFFCSIICIIILNFFVGSVFASEEPIKLATSITPQTVTVNGITYEKLDLQGGLNLSANTNSTGGRDFVYNTQRTGYYTYLPDSLQYRYLIGVSNKSSWNDDVLVGICFSDSIPRSGGVGSAAQYFYKQAFNLYDRNETMSFTSFDCPGGSFAYLYINNTLSIRPENLSIWRSVDKNDISSINSNLENIDDSINNMTNTITDSNITNVDTDLPSDSTSDVTESGFANIFDNIRENFTTDNQQSATITIPFTNKSFVISKESVYGEADLGFLEDLIKTFWWFTISIFIVKDISKKVQKIKEGNIENIQNTNIKEDLL